MKQKDIALIIVVVFASAVLSTVLSKVLISTPNNRSQKAEVVSAINSDFPALDTKYFNSNSIDPTKLINIGDNNNNTPFNNTSQ